MREEMGTGNGETEPPEGVCLSEEGRKEIRCTCMLLLNQAMKGSRMGDPGFTAAGRGQGQGNKGTSRGCFLLAPQRPRQECSGPECASHRCVESMGRMPGGPPTKAQASLQTAVTGPIYTQAAIGLSPPPLSPQWNSRRVRRQLTDGSVLSRGTHLYPGSGTPCPQCWGGAPATVTTDSPPPKTYQRVSKPRASYSVTFHGKATSQV